MKEIEADAEKVLDIELTILHFVSEELADFSEFQNYCLTCLSSTRALAPEEKFLGVASLDLALMGHELVELVQFFLGDLES